MKKDQMPELNLSPADMEKVEQAHRKLVKAIRRSALRELLDDPWATLLIGLFFLILYCATIRILDL